MNISQSAKPVIDFERAVAEHRRRMFRQALKMTRNVDDAQDLVQDSLLRATQGITNYDADRPFGAWISRTVTNTAIDNVRKRMRRVSEVSYDSPSDGAQMGVTAEMFPDLSRGPEEEALAETLPEVWIEALDQISGMEKDLVKRVANGQSYEDIAGEYEIPVGTVRSRVFRARQKVQSWFQNHRPDLAGNWSQATVGTSFEV